MVEVEIGGNGAMSDMEESGKQNGRPQEHGQESGWSVAWQVDANGCIYPAGEGEQPLVSLIELIAVL